MRWISSILVAALLIQVGYVPCAAEEPVPPKGDEIDRSKFRVGMYVEVTYYSEKGKEDTATGYIRTVEDDSVTIGRGLWKKRIAYRDIRSLRDPKQKALKAKVVPGARVRITAPGVVSHPFPGALMALDTDTLVIKSESGRQVDIPLTSVTRIELSLGRESKARKGALMGLFAGATFGVILGASMGGEDYYDPNAVVLFYRGAYVNRPSKIGMAIGMGCLLGIVGTAVGAFIGSRTEGGEERWNDVPLPVRLGFSSQCHGGLVLSASFVF